MTEDSHERLKEKYYKLIGNINRVVELLPETIRRRD